MIDVISLLFTYDIGGLERVLLDMMRDRQRRGHLRYGVVIINNSYSEDLLNKLRATGAPVFLLNRQKGDRKFAPFIELLRLVRRHRVKLIHTREHDMAPIALLVKLLNPRVKLLASFHNTNLLTLSGFKVWILNEIYNRHIAISDAVKREIEERGIDRPITVMNNAVDVLRFSSISPDEKGASQQFRVICVARFFLRQKAQDLLLRAVAECRRRGVEIHLTLMGNVDGRNEEDYAALLHFAKTERIDDLVTFVINKTNVEDYLSKADLFALPSHFEGFGNVVIEAMASGLPVLVSRVDGLTEIVSEHKEGFFVQAGSERDLVDKLAWAAENRQRLREMGLSGRQKATKFGIDCYADRYEAIYRATISNDNR